jgi:hypothetical protein
MHFGQPGSPVSVNGISIRYLSVFFVSWNIYSFNAITIGVNARALRVPHTSFRVHYKGAGKGGIASSVILLFFNFSNLVSTLLHGLTKQIPPRVTSGGVVLTTPGPCNSKTKAHSFSTTCHLSCSPFLPAPQLGGSDTGLAPGPAVGYRYLAPASAEHPVLSRACSPIIISLDLAAKGHWRIILGLNRGQKGEPAFYPIITPPLRFFPPPKKIKSAGARAGAGRGLPVFVLFFYLSCCTATQ